MWPFATLERRVQSCASPKVDSLWDWVDAHTHQVTNLFEMGLADVRVSSFIKLRICKRVSEITNTNPVCARLPNSEVRYQKSLLWPVYTLACHTSEADKTRDNQMVTVKLPLLEQAKFIGEKGLVNE